MANTSSIFQVWISSGNYDKFDVAWGINANDPAYYYSTMANNSGYHPSGRFIYAVSSHSRQDDTATVYFTKTGSGPNFAAGSLVNITGMSDRTFSYTGMVIEGGSNYIKFVSAGYNVGVASDTVGAINTLWSPAWTTGFFFVPSYSSPVESEQNVITAKFEPGYEQRQAASINSNADTWTLNFNDRSNKEVRAIRNYVQDRAGVYSTQIMMPVSALENDPTLKYVLGNVKLTPKSFNINDCSITARQVFDI